MEVIIEPKTPLNVKSDNEIQFSFVNEEGVPIDVEASWIQLEIESQGVKFFVDNNPDGKKINCYTDAENNLVVTIPSYTFSRTGNILYTVNLKEPNGNFPDGYKDTWTPLVDIEVAYFKNYEEDRK